VFLHADLRSDGLILLLDRELRRIVRWRGSDTGSWRCQDSRIPGRRLFFFPQWPVERPCKRGRRLEAVRDADNAPTHNTAISGKQASISLHAAAVASPVAILVEMWGGERRGWRNACSAGDL
jgi:hypothetical protein